LHTSRVPLRRGTGNSLPNITAWTFNGTEDTVLTGQIAASDPGDTITFASAAAPANGVLTVSAAGAFNYTPSANFDGNVSFTARVTDSAHVSAHSIGNLLFSLLFRPAVR
jgi:hypothetical protein